jgi:hypothetical protein
MTDVERYPVYAPSEGPACHSKEAAAEAQQCYDRAGTTHSPIHQLTTVTLASLPPCYLCNASAGPH